LKEIYFRFKFDDSGAVLDIEFVNGAVGAIFVLTEKFFAVM
jgi:hypothetical protein